VEQAFMPAVKFGKEPALAAAVRNRADLLVVPRKMLNGTSVAKAGIVLSILTAGINACSTLVV
jgi:hypothetical protein